MQSKYSLIDTKSIKTFDDFPLSSKTLKALKECGYEEPTEIQRESLSLCLRGLDLLGAAKTGSGKTLAFLIPLLEKLFCLKWSRIDGLGAMVITPTRELAYQIFETLRKVGKYHDFSAGLVIGGKDLKFERGRLAQCNVIICTPGRILHHMDENPSFDASTLQLLVLDEADRCLDLGFAETMNAILANLPSESRQTLLYSATQTKSVKDLARLSLKKPVFVSVHENAQCATPDKLTQHFIVCELEQKINTLWSFIKNHRKKKVLVFMQSCKQVKYVEELFKRIKCGVSLMALHGKLHQLRRMAIYDEFCKRDKAVVLLATDVAARGLDFPAVDWVYQLDCPEDATTYVHRVGRTARHSAVGQSLLVLLPSEEEGMLQQLRAHKIPIDKIEVDQRKMQNMQKKIEAQLASDPELKASAQRAFQSYIKSTYLLKNKAVFDVFKLETDKFASSLGLAVPPRVRFLQKQLKNKNKNKLLEMNDSDDENEEDDVLTLKRKDHAVEGNNEEESEPLLDEKVNNNNKVVTKAGLAKKVLKRKIQANQVTKFNDEGEGEGESLKASNEGKAYDKEDDQEAGINIDKVKQILKAEDKFDRVRAKEMKKERVREEKRKAREASKRKAQEEEELDSDDSESGGNLDWLPDPDKIYGQQEKAESSSKPKWKPPKKEKPNLAKKKRTSQEEELDEEDSSNHLGMDEELALSLLRK